MTSEKGLLSCMLAESTRREFVNNTTKNVKYNNVQKRRECCLPNSCICILRMVSGCFASLCIWRWPIIVSRTSTCEVVALFRCKNSGPTDLQKSEPCTLTLPTRPSTVKSYSSNRRRWWVRRGCQYLTLGSFEAPTSLWSGAGWLLLLRYDNRRGVLSSTLYA